MFALETFNLRKEFKGLLGKPVVAVQDHSLQVPMGSVFGFLGPNGAGKTTTIQMVLGNVYPTRGRTRVLGGSIHDLAIKRRIGFLPEKFQFHEFLSAEEFLRLHASLAGVPAREQAQRVDRVLSLVGLAERRKSKIKEFSKGMQQRAGLAQAIIHDPDLVILDEPTSALDPFGRRLVRDVVQQLKDQGKTVFINSHLLSEIELTCDFVAILNKGLVIKQGPIDELLSDKSVVTMEVVNPSEAVIEAARRVAGHVDVQTVPTDQPTVVTANAKLVTQVETPEQVADLAQAVVQAGGRLMSMQYKRETLEDFFIRTVTSTETAE